MKSLTTHTEASMKVTNNGRKSLPELNEMFDKVIIRYFTNTVTDKHNVEKEVVKTMVALVSGINVHIGVSKWSNRGLLYSKTKGRAIAMGRAEIAFNNYKSTETPREAHYSGTDPLAYSAVIKDPTVKNIVQSFLAVEDKSEWQKQWDEGFAKLPEIELRKDIRLD